MVFRVADDGDASAVFADDFAFGDGFGRVIRAFGVKVRANGANQFGDGRFGKNRHVIDKFKRGDDFGATRSRFGARTGDKK